MTEETELAHFTEWGYIRTPQALPAAFVARVQDAVWGEWRRLAGVSREDPATWRIGWVGINKTRIDEAAGVEIGPRLRETVDQFLGTGRWRPLGTLGGLLLTMPEELPEPWNVVTAGWHLDNDPRRYLAAVE